MSTTRRPARSIIPAALLLATALLAVGCSAAPAGDSDAPTTTPTTATSTTSTAVSPPNSTAAPATTSLPRETTTIAEEGGVVRLTIVYDNYVHDPLLADGWGFAALVEVSEQQILFDTGADGTALLGNLGLLGIDPSTLDALVLSHEHGDHTGGLAALLATGAAPPVYLPASFSPALTARVTALTEVIEVAGPHEILPGVFSTGEMGRRIVEQALVIATPEGSVVITGCAHPGIVEMVRRAQEILPGPVALVLGGFHLSQSTIPQIRAVVDAFRELGVEKVAPTHCTGEAAREAFAREYGDDLVEAGVGRVIEVG